MPITSNTPVEIVHVASGDIIVCDALGYCLSVDDGLRDEADAIRAALAAGMDYDIGVGAAAGFIIRLAPADAIVIQE